MELDLHLLWLRLATGASAPVWGVEGEKYGRGFAVLHFRSVAEAINNVNNIKMWRYDNMNKGAKGIRKLPTKDEMREYALKNCGDNLPVVVHEDGEVELFENGKWINAQTYLRNCIKINE